MNGARFWDRVRCWFLPRSHRRRIRRARRVLRKIRPWLQEPQGAPRVFGYLRKIDPLSFEELVLQSFVDMGWKVKRGTHYSGDGGIDGHVRLPGDPCWTAIQCKRYSSAIDPRHVREFASLVYPKRGLFVHTGRTGHQSKEAATGVTFISGQRLADLVAGRLEFPSAQLSAKGRTSRPT
jgi:restriction system protein